MAYFWGGAGKGNKKGLREFELVNKYGKGHGVCKTVDFFLQIPKCSLARLVFFINLKRPKVDMYIDDKNVLRSKKL